MMRAVRLASGACILTAALGGCTQPVPRHDRAVLADDTNRLSRQLIARAPGSQPAPSEPKLAWKASTEHLDRPTSPAQFRQAWHRPPVVQGLTGQCWSFGTTSFFESEVHRLSGRELHLSVMHSVYWEFVEKARRFVRQRGASEFGRGSEPDAVIRTWKTYGVVPEDAYTGLPSGCDFYDDRKMVAEMRAALSAMQKSGAWNEERALVDIRAILDRHMGRPPEHVEIDGRTMTPQAYLRDVVRLDLDDYVCLLSLMQQPFDAWCEFPVPDNWWHSRGYYNLALVDFVRVLRGATAAGQSLCIGIDNTEPGFVPDADVAFIPTFDIPAGHIDDSARQFRFAAEQTTDDHVVHLVGSCRHAGSQWYLIKDSGTHCRNGTHGGYMFYREDYLRLKMLIMLLPRTVAEQALGRRIPSAPP